MPYTHASTCALPYQGLAGKASGPSSVARGTVPVIRSGKMQLMCHSELVGTHAFECSSHWPGHQCVQLRLARAASRYSAFPRVAVVMLMQSDCARCPKSGGHLIIWELSRLEDQCAPPLGLTPMHIELFTLFLLH